MLARIAQFWGGNEMTPHINAIIHIDFGGVCDLFCLCNFPLLILIRMNNQFS